MPNLTQNPLCRICYASKMSASYVQSLGPLPDLSKKIMLRLQCEHCLSMSVYDPVLCQTSKRRVTTECPVCKTLSEFDWPSDYSPLHAEPSVRVYNAISAQMCRLERERIVELCIAFGPHLASLIIHCIFDAENDAANYQAATPFHRTATLLSKIAARVYRIANACDKKQELEICARPQAIETKD